MRGQRNSDLFADERNFAVEEERVARRRCGIGTIVKAKDNQLAEPAGRSLVAEHHGDATEIIGSAFRCARLIIGGDRDQLFPIGFRCIRRAACRRNEASNLRSGLLDGRTQGFIAVEQLRKAAKLLLELGVRRRRRGPDQGEQGFGSVIERLGDRRREIAFHDPPCQ